jgi:hypothetical protein
VNWFTIAVIALFMGASVVELTLGHVARSLFYVLSAAINICVIFMK